MAAFEIIPASALAGLLADITDSTLQNVALNRAAYQSDSIDDDHDAHLATDGSAETYWESKPGGNAWIAVDLGEPCSFSHVTLRWAESHVAGFRLQTSNEASQPKTWRDIFATTNGTGGVQEIPVLPTTARHLRLQVAASALTKRGCALAEIEVKGKRESHFKPSPQPTPLAGAPWFSPAATGNFRTPCSYRPRRSRLRKPEAEVVRTLQKFGGDHRTTSGSNTIR